MARFGFPSTDLEPFADQLREDLAGERAALSRVYGITDREAAQEFGYSLPSRRNDELPEPQPRGESYLMVLKGTSRPGLPAPSGSPGKIGTADIPEGGCVGEADRKFGFDPDISPYGLAHDLWVENQLRLQSGSVWRVVVQEWVACMAEAGYRVTDPLSDKGDIEDVQAEREATGATLPDSEEIRLALADVDCKERFDLVDRLNKEASRMDRDAIEEHELALKEDRRRLDGQIKLASGLLDEVE